MCILKIWQNKSSAISLCRGEATRTPDLYVPNVARYQLRYTPLNRFAIAKLMICLKVDKRFAKYFSQKLLGHFSVSIAAVNAAHNLSSGTGAST